MFKNTIKSRLNYLKIRKGAFLIVTIKLINMNNTFFPNSFVKKYKELLGDEWDEFLKCISQKKPKSFWVNTNLATIEEVKEELTKKGISFEQLPFHPQAFEIFILKPGDLGLYKLGKISLQEKASIMPAVALGVNETDTVFDTCASPGMKTIQLSNFATKGNILATDVNSKRSEILKEIKEKFKLNNVQTKRIDFRNIKRNKRFDKILLDAPCSSEGIVRKSREALVYWSPELVRKKAAIQKNLITKAFDYLKDGGEMIYSTCSFAPEENEEVVMHLLKEKKNASVEKINLPGIKMRENKICKNCVRFYPQDNNTQQFFIAKIKKCEIKE